MTILSKYRKILTQKGSDGFTIIPNCLLNGPKWKVGDKDMLFRHRSLLIALLSFDFHGGKFKVGACALKETAGLGYVAIRRATKELMDEGILLMSDVPNCRNEYDLTPFYEKFITLHTPQITTPPVVKRGIAEDVQILIDESKRVVL
jgi:hypothetical protein